VAVRQKAGAGLVWSPTRPPAAVGVAGGGGEVPEVGCTLPPSSAGAGGSLAAVFVIASVGGRSVGESSWVVAVGDVLQIDA
jgi:hypothetical protein